ncbi:MAG: heme-binding protein [Steroidobacteraceae bacterium]
MRSLILVLGAFAAGVSASAAPATAGTAAPSSGFPGDHGRPFDGLPFPPGPLPPRPPERPLPRAPSIDLMLEAAKAIVGACKGYHVGVSVIDSAGTPKLYYIPDGTDGSHAYTGFRKAYTALTFKMPTSQVGALTRTDPSVAARIKSDTNLLTFAGGLPLTVGGEVIGAIGVSGAEPSAKDEECALAGIGKIKDRLK